MLVLCWTALANNKETDELNKTLRNSHLSVSYGNNNKLSYHVIYTKPEQCYLLAKLSYRLIFA